MKPVELKIIPATIDDKELFYQFMLNYYYPEEPMDVSLGRIPKSINELPLLKCLTEGLSLTAINVLDESEDNTIGVVFSSIRRPDPEEEGHAEGLKQSSDPVAYAKILDALEILEKESKLWERTKVDKTFHTQWIATKGGYRGLNIGKKLLQHSLELAKSLNFECATIECSGLYSSKIAADLGYESYYELAYEDYRDKNNQMILPVKPPHKALVLYVKKL